jgi:hypothetical protein
MDRKDELVRTLRRPRLDQPKEIHRLKFEGSISVALPAGMQPDDVAIVLEWAYEFLRYDDDGFLAEFPFATAAVARIERIT